MMYEVLRPLVCVGEVLYNGVDRDQSSAGENRAVPHSMVAHSLMLQPLHPRQTGWAAVLLVFTRGRQLGSQPLSSKWPHCAEGCPAERAHASVGVAQCTGKVAVVTLSI